VAAGLYVEPRQWRMGRVDTGRRQVGDDGKIGNRARRRPVVSLLDDRRSVAESNFDWLGFVSYELSLVVFG
jgi:hypothetical protein